MQRAIKPTRHKDSARASKAPGHRLKSVHRGRRHGRRRGPLRTLTGGDPRNTHTSDPVPAAPSTLDGANHPPVIGGSTPGCGPEVRKEPGEAGAHDCRLAPRAQRTGAQMAVRAQRPPPPPAPVPACDWCPKLRGRAFRRRCARSGRVCPGATSALPALRSACSSPGPPRSHRDGGPPAAARTSLVSEGKGEPGPRQGVSLEHGRRAQP